MSASSSRPSTGWSAGPSYALLALGLAVIFGMLRVVNFAHGAFYMLGAFGAYLLLTEVGVPFWWALLIVPLALGLLGMGVERALVHRLARLDPLYNFLLTFGLTLVLQDLVQARYGIQSSPYAHTAALAGTVDFGLFDFPAYRVFVLAFAIVACVAVWWLLGAHAGRHGGARRDRAAGADPGARHRRGALGDAGVRVRHRAGRRWPGCWPRRCGRSTR